MATIVETLLPLFSTPDAPTDHDALCQQVRDYVNSDATGEVDLTEEIKDGTDKFQDLYNGGDYNPAHATDMRVLSRIVKAITSVRTEQEAARAELDEEFSSVAAELDGTLENKPTVPAEAEERPAATQAAQDPGSEQPPAPAEERPAATQAAQDHPDGETAPDADGEFSQSSKFKVRPASTPVRLPSPSSANAFRGANPLPETARRKYSIIAAADVPRTTSGSTLSMRELAEATNRRFGIMPLNQKGVGAKRGSIALIKRTFDRAMTTYNDRRDASTIDRAADERNLPGGSLIAAARTHRQALTAAGCCTTMTNDVWCAPSETDYTLCPPLATLEGLVDLPTIPVNQGGIRYPVWEQTPTDWHGTVVVNDCDTPLAPDYFTIDGNEKVCIEGPCPDWQEKRMSLAYLCVQGDILRDRSWPELTERFISDTLVKHAHYMNHQYLANIWADSDPLADYDVSAGGIGSVSDSLLDRLGLLIAWFRERYHLGMTDTLEGIAPAWFKEYVKLDLARKNNRPFASVTDAEVDELFANYATRVQWVYDTEGITTDASLANGTPVDGRMMPGVWPNNVEMVFFPAGSWVLGQQDVITLDAFYDSTKLAQNKYTALFTEEGFLLLNRCNRSFRVRLTNLCRGGGVAELAAVTCPENPPPADPATLSAASTDSGSTGSASTARRSSKSSGS